MSENWLPVVGYESSYEVSDLGRVRSLTRLVNGKYGNLRKHKGQVLALSFRGQDYPGISLSRSKEKKYRLVHQLLTTAFLGPRPQGQVVRHIDGNPKNCKLSNLAYGTYAENEADKEIHGTRLHGEEIKSSKLNVQAVTAIRASSASQSQLARDYGVHQGTIWRILRRETWAHV